MFFFSKKNNRNGFTLIELLAVILILAIIALIAIPVIQDIVKSAKKEALRDTAYGLAEAGQNKCSSSTLQGTWDETLVQFENNEETSEAKLSDYFNGKNPDAGEVSVNDNCKTAVAIWNDSVKTCAYKGYSDDKVALISMKNSNTCRLEASGDLDEDYVDTSSTGYKCSNPGSVVATETQYFTFNQATKTITGYDVTGPKDVVIPCTIGGVNVENIGSGAFASKSLTSVLMPDTILTIGSAAFQYNSITKLELGSSVTSIGSLAFFGNQITDIAFPDSLKTIADGAWVGGYVSGSNRGVFEQNPLVSVTFGTGIEYIGQLSFQGLTTLKNLDISRSTKLVTIGYSAFNGTKIITLLTIPDSVKTIDSNAFANSSLVSVTINGNNSSIKANAFANNLIGELNITGTITEIGADAFKNNQLDAANAYIRGKNSDGTNNTTLVSYGGSNRSNISIPNDITSLSGATFSGLGLSGTLVIGNGITAIESGKFTSNTLTNVTIGDAVTTIGSTAFQYNTINNLQLGSSVTTIGSLAFFGNQITNLTFPDSLKTIADGAWVGGYVSGSNRGVFEQNPLVSVTFGSGIEYIGQLSFQGLTTLKNLDISRSTKLVTIGYSAFNGTKIITPLTIPNSVKTIDSNAFANSSLVSVTINGNNLAIKANAFANNMIDELNMTGTIIEIGADAFKNNQLDAANAYIRGRNSDGTQNTTLVSYGGSNRSNISIPNDITSLSGATFSGLGLSGTLVIGNGITAVESGKFTSNTLTNVTIGNAVTTIGSTAFQYNAISNLQLGSSVATIEPLAFFGNQITNLTFPDSLKKIGDGGWVGGYVSGSNRGVFEQNPLVSVTFGSGIEYIGQLSFQGLTTLKNLDISRSTNLITIGYSAFTGTKIITPLTIPNSVKTIDSNAFANSSLVSVTINGNNLAIKANAFANNMIDDLNMTGTIIEIGADAFKNNQLDAANAYIRGRNSDGTQNTTLVSYGGSNRSNISIPNDITSLSGATFSGLGLSGTLVIGNGITAVESGKFTSNTLTNVTIGNAVTTIGSTAFQYNSITNLQLGSSVATIGSLAFFGNQITNLTLPDSLKTIGDGAWVGGYVSGSNRGVFEQNPLVSVTFGSGIEYIGQLAFQGLTTLTNIDLTKSINLITIGSSSFSSTRATNVEIPASVTTIGGSAFSSNLSGSTILVKGKVDSSNFTSLGSGWNGNSNIIYELSSCYTYSGNTITNYNSICSKNIEIPSNLGGNTITTIASNAFESKGLVRVVLPSSIMSIGDNAFSGNTIDPIIVMGKTNSGNFTSLGTNWNNSSKVIYDLNDVTCFDIASNTISNYYNESVCPKNIVIPNGITVLSDNAFADNLLTNVDLNGVTTIGNSAFINNKLSSITIPNTVTTIGNTPFNGNLLSSMTILDGTNFTSLGTSWNGNVLKVNFQGTSIEKNCFITSGNSITKYQAYCPETIDIPTSIEGVNVTSIADNAFKGSAVRYINIPSVITSIGANAFEGNDIVTLGLNDGLVTIGANAFKDTGLLTLSIPSTVMTIGDSAFALNNGLSVIYVNGKTSSAGFTSLGTSWNGTCNNIIYNG